MKLFHQRFALGALCTLFWFVTSHGQEADPFGNGPLDQLDDDPAEIGAPPSEPLPRNNEVNGTSPPLQRRRPNPVPPPPKEEITTPTPNVPSIPQIAPVMPAPEKPSGSGTTPRFAGVSDDVLNLEDSIRNQYIESQFEFRDGDIQDVVKAISKLTSKNFILDPKVRGKITILGPSKVTVQEAYEAFLSALQMNEYTLVSSGKFLKIIRHQDASRSNIETYAGEFTPNNDNYITKIYPLKYINAEDVARELRELTPRFGKITPYAPTNTIIITDTGRNIRRLLQIIRLIDVKGFELELDVIPVTNAGAKELGALIDSIIAEKSPSQTGTAARRTTTARNQRRRTEGGGEIAKIVPEERTNSLIVLANSQGIREIRSLVKKLDIADQNTNSGKIQVYYCKHTDATELATTLANLSSGGTQAATRTRSGARTSNTGGASAVVGGVTANFEGGVKVTADKATNSLVIQASRADYDTLMRVIERLDIPRRQVYIEAVIMELAINDSTNVGLHYNYAADGLPRAAGFSPNNDLVKYFGDPTAISGLVLGYATGDSQNFTLPNGKAITIKSLSTLLTAIQVYAESNILSTPQILATDNEESEIKIEDKIPVQGSAVASQGVSTSNITEKSLGITLKITPQISGDMVRMKIDQTVNNLSAERPPQSLQGTNISTTERATKTVVVVPNKDTVVIGGLIRDTVLDTENKIPILGDIPLIGWLFKGKEMQRRKTNLLLFITPHVIDGRKDATAIAEKKLNQRSKFIKNNLGGKDFFAEDADEIRQQINLQKTQPDISLRSRATNPAPVSGSLSKPIQGTTPATTPEWEEDVLDDPPASASGNQPPTEINTSRPPPPEDGVILDTPPVSPSNPPDGEEGTE